MTTTFESLPNEIIIKIIDHLSFDDLISLYCSSHTFHPFVTKIILTRFVNELKNKLPTEYLLYGRYLKHYNRIFFFLSQFDSPTISKLFTNFSIRQQICIYAQSPRRDLRFESAIISEYKRCHNHHFGCSFMTQSLKILPDHLLIPFVLQYKLLI